MKKYTKQYSIINAFLVWLMLTALGQDMVSHAQKSDTLGRGIYFSGNFGPVRIATSPSNSFSNKAIHLYTQSDLAEIGIFPGAIITSMAWKKGSNGVLINGSSVNVRVSLRSNVDTIAYGTGSTTTFPIDSYIGSRFTFAGSRTFSATGTNFPADSVWVPIPFSANYTYTGGSLEVLLDAAYTAGTGNPASGNIYWKYSTMPVNTCIFTGSAAAYTTANASLGTYRPDAVFTFFPGPDCSGTPLAGTIGLQTVKACPGMLTAHLRLKGASAANGVKVQWEKKAPGQSSFAAIAGATRYDLLNETITAATEYRATVTCGGQKVTSANFTMNPASFLAPPFLQDFETGATWTQYAPLISCWEFKKGLLEAPVVFTTTIGAWTSDGWRNSGTFGAAKMVPSLNSYDWLLSPGLDLGTGNWQLEFDLGIFTSGAATAGVLDKDDIVAVVISTDGGNTWSEDNVLQRWDSTKTPLSSDGTKHVIIPLTRYAGKVSIGFYVAGNGLGPVSGASPDVMIDNVQIVGSCTPRMPVAISGPISICRNAAAAYSVPQVSGVSGYSWILPSGWSGSSNSNSITVVPDGNSGILRVIANSASCGSSDTQSVAITVVPQPRLLPDTLLSFCAGDSVLLYTEAVGAYTWLRDNQVLTGALDSMLYIAAAGGYSVVTRNGSCSDTSIKAHITMHSRPVPVIDHKGNLLATTQKFAAYQWYFNNSPVEGETGSEYMARDSGLYKVAVVDSNGCEGISENAVLGGKTGIDMQGIDAKGLQVYPVPVEDVLHLVYTGKITGKETIVLSDVNGRILYSEKITAVKTILSTAQLPAGIYFVKLSGNDNVLVKKILKSR